MQRDNPEEMHMQLNFDQDEMASLISTAVLTGLGEEQRDILIQHAIQHMLTAKKDTYGRSSTTPLQDAFDLALDRYTNSAMLRLLEENDDLREQVEAGARQLLAAIGKKEIDHELQGKLAVTLIEHLDEKRRASY